MQSVLIVGYGFVGQALEIAVSKNAGFEVHIHDPAKNHFANYLNEYDLVFICLPTPSLPDGHCDDLLVEDMTSKIAISGKAKTIIVKSTIAPSTAMRLGNTSDKIAIWPEFLRQAHAHKDFLAPPITVIGANHGQTIARVEKFIRDLYINTSAGYFTTTPEIASMYKMVANSYLAMKVVFVHQLHLWMESAGYKASDRLAMQTLMERDARIGPTHNVAPGAHGYGYAGACFPKDVQAFYEETNGGFSLLQSVMSHNEDLRKLK